MFQKHLVTVSAKSSVNFYENSKAIIIIAKGFATIRNENFNLNTSSHPGLERSESREDPFFTSRPLWRLLRLFASLENNKILK